MKDIMIMRRVGLTPRRKTLGNTSNSVVCIVTTVENYKEKKPNSIEEYPDRNKELVSKTKYISNLTHPHTVKVQLRLMLSGSI